MARVLQRTRPQRLFDIPFEQLLQKFLALPLGELLPPWEEGRLRFFLIEKQREVRHGGDAQQLVGGEIDAGSPAGQWALSYLVSDPELKVRLLQQAAGAKLLPGMYRLATLGLKGIRGYPDRQHSLALLCEAAEKGHAASANNLAKIFRYGLHGVHSDLERSVRLIRFAAEAGHVRAQTTLSHRYKEGIGVEVDVEKEAHWLKQAHMNGSEGRTLAERFLELAQEEPSPLTPWGQWRPKPLVHCWVMEDSVHLQVLAVLMLKNREDTLFSRLPKHLILRICFWCVTPPFIA